MAWRIGTEPSPESRTAHFVGMYMRHQVKRILKQEVQYNIRLYFVQIEGAFLKKQQKAA